MRGTEYWKPQLGTVAKLLLFSLFFFFLVWFDTRQSIECGLVFGLGGGWLVLA